MPAKPLTRGKNVADFFAAFLHHTKGPAAGNPFLLEEWQREFVDEFYRLDPVTGRRVYRLGILGIPRGNGKSPMAAGFGLYELVSRKDSPDIFCVAGSKDQAQIVTDFARAFVDTGKLRNLISGGRRYLTYDQAAGVMRVLAASGSLQHGLMPSAFLADELHAFMSEAQEETWHALWTGLHKRPDSFALAITTAGYDKHTLLGRMYEDCLKFPDRDDSRPCLRIRRDRENGVLFYWYGIPEQLEDDWQNEELWKASNPASWVSVDELGRQLHSPGSDEYDFKRLHLNMWTAARDSWLPAGVWSNLGPQGEPPVAVTMPAGGDVYVGVDIGWTHDSSAVCWAHDNGEKVVLRSKVWTTLPDQLGEYVPGGKMRLSLVEDFIRKLARDFRVREVAYDPNYFGRSAEDLEREGLVTVEMLPSSAPMVNAWQTFYQAAMEGKLAHDGDKVLSAHVEAAAASKTEYGWRVRKLRSTSRIDALAAAVLAHGRCELQNRTQSTPQILWLDGPDEEED